MTRYVDVLVLTESYENKDLINEEYKHLYTYLILQISICLKFSNVIPLTYLASFSTDSFVFALLFTIICFKAYCLQKIYIEKIQQIAICLYSTGILKLIGSIDQRPIDLWCFRYVMMQISIQYYTNLSTKTNLPSCLLLTKYTFPEPPRPMVLIIL